MVANTPELNAWIDVHRTCVREQLQTIDLRRRTVFATSCAERFIWCFLNDTSSSERQEDRQFARRSLDLLWDALADHGPFKPNRDLERLNAMPELSSDEEPPGFAAFRGDGLAILAYALESSTGDPEPARWAAQRAFDTANFADDEPQLSATGAERSYLLTFRELRQQISDLALLKCLPESDSSVVRSLSQESKDYGQQFYAAVKQRSC